MPAKSHHSVRHINNSSTILPYTRVDLHTIFTASDIISSYEAVCTQLEHSAFTVFSNSKNWKIISGVLNKFQVPLLSVELPTSSEREENPFTVFLGPDKEDLTNAVTETVKKVSQERIVVITHNTSVLILDKMMISLQESKKKVIIENLEGQDIRLNLKSEYQKVTSILFSNLSTIDTFFLAQRGN